MPTEKTIIENIPFSQGVQDYSMILGERKFNNRLIEYRFTAFHMDYPNRKVLEQTIKRQVAMNGNMPLYDSHDEGFFWLGKCKSVEIDDDEEFKQLNVTLIFDVYPFMLAKDDYLEDDWDTLQFNHHAINFNDYHVDGELTVTLYNWGDRKVYPVIEVDS